MENQKRQRTIVDRAIQGKFALIFGLGAFSSVMLVSLLYGQSLETLAGAMPNDGAQLRSSIAGVMLRNVVLGTVFVVPLFVVLSLVTSIRLLGPVESFRRYLRDLIGGRRPEACRLRREDELQDICELLNRATASLRELSGDDQEAADRAAAAEGIPAPLPQRKREAAAQDAKSA